MCSDSVRGEKKSRNKRLKNIYFVGKEGKRKEEISKVIVREI